MALAIWKFCERYGRNRQLWITEVCYASEFGAAFMREKGYVGQANTFLSYAQAGKWEDSNAAIADGGANRSRYVWIDVFAVRQWTCAIPEMDFGSIISNCTSVYRRSIHT